MTEQLSALQIADELDKSVLRLHAEAAAELRRLHEENERLRDDYLRTCGLVADMYAAATGGHDGPRRGVVEDIQDLRAVNQELLEALKSLAHYAECQVAAFNTGCPYLDMTLFPRLCSDARAAIAKAEGETK